VTLIDDLEDFVHDHRPHSSLTVGATEPAWNGYLLTAACPRAVIFARRMTPEAAKMALLQATSLNWASGARVDVLRNPVAGFGVGRIRRAADAWRSPRSR
jgi:hypothetical protein